MDHHIRAPKYSLPRAPYSLFPSLDVRAVELFCEIYIEFRSIQFEQYFVLVIIFVEKAIYTNFTPKLLIFIYF